VPDYFSELQRSGFLAAGVSRADVLIEAVDRLGPPHPQPCSMCPWRVENHQKAAEDVEPGSEPVFYTAGRRQAMWTNWGPSADTGLCDGGGMICHKTQDKTITPCAGGDALQQRAVLRAWRSHELSPLRTWNAVRKIVRTMLDARSVPIRTTGGRWTLNGELITFTRLLEAAHPAVFNPGIASEQVPAPTPAELEEWRGGA
jgi:hypothetical protein